MHRSTIVLATILGLLLLVPKAALSLDVADTALQARDYTMAGDARYTRVVIHFDRKPEPHTVLLRNPYRLAIDLPPTRFSFDPRALAPRGLIDGVQYGEIGSDRSRLLLKTRGPFKVADLQVIANETSDGFRMIVELRAVSAADFDNALLAAVTGPAAVRREGGGGTVGRFTVALDPGHGGADGGARGVNGTAEKTITLIFAMELARKLEELGRFDVVLTRDRDRFLRLDERVRIAREKGARLFVSIHADSIGYPSMRGATVYTVSDKASDAEAAATAARENLSDAIAGKVVEAKKDEVEDILVDLIRRETHAFSIRFARTLVGELSTTTQMVNNPHRYAGFRVLTAPDIPSVLLELGYLSNVSDEKQLRDPAWRSKAMDAVVAAIDTFARAQRGAGG